jgi:hypothetical protein
MRNNNGAKEDHEDKIFRRSTSSDRIELFTGNIWNENPKQTRHDNIMGAFEKRH